MYYHTPNTSRLVKFILRYRLFILIFVTLTSLGALFLLQPKIMTSDTSLWLNDSKEYQKTLDQHYTAKYLSTLILRVPEFDDTAKKKMIALTHDLAQLDGVSTIDSLFSSTMIYNQHSSEESALVKAIPLENLSSSQIQSYVHIFPAPYRQFVTPDFKEFRIIIHATHPVSLTSLDIPYSYSYEQPQNTINSTDAFMYVGLFILLILAASRIMFKNYIAGGSALAVLSATLIGTFTFIYILTGERHIHLSMIMMVISIALGHFLYFYYRWHVSQYKANATRALEKCLNRNILPAFWSLPVLIISLGSLQFSDSDIVTAISLAMMVSSAVSYTLNIVFLPAILSYFTAVHPKVQLAKVCYWFANREIHYNPKLLRLFILFTTILAVILAIRFSFLQDPFQAKRHTETLTIQVPFKEIDLSTLKKIDLFEQSLQSSFPEVQSIDSIASVLHQLNYSNEPKTKMDEQRLLQALFFLELYDLDKRYIDEDSLKITITLHQASLSEIVKYLSEYKSLDIYMTDTNALAESAKDQQKNLLIGALVVALFIIAITMGIIFQSWLTAVIALAANAIPLVWFILFMMLFHFELSIEALIAMTISVGLSSDTIIHFGYKYLRSRYFGRSQKHALEIMFFYSGVPAIISAFLLMIVFTALIFSSLHTLQLIGAYGAVLMFISLLSDLFVFPVLLLSIDKKTT